MPERYLGKSLGKYRVEELIGSGGFAWVYRGFDPTLGIPVALKVLKPQFAGDPNFEERFRREASTAARLRHPNIIKIYEVGRDGDAVYFAMDFLPSGLATRLETSPCLPEDVVMRVGIDVARAIGFAHREGVIHRDIKVDNILFDVHGNAVVADFGIARAVSGYTQQTGTNMVVGTPQYFAPEQARAKPLDGRADVYSLGVSLYRAAVGRLPFEGDDWYEIARAHVEDPPPPPRSINPAISPAFERLLLRCLAKHPDDRPATGEQLADELAAVLSSPRTSGSLAPLPGAFLSPTETPTVTDSPAVRHRAYSGVQRAGVAILATGILAAGAILWLGNIASAKSPTPPPVLDGAVATMDQAIADSLRQATAAGLDSILASDLRRRGDTSLRGAPVGGLAVRAVDGANLSLNGIDIGRGTWSADTMRPGAYTVRASIPSAEGCSSAFASRSVTLRPGTREQVTLSVKPCGFLRIALRNRPLPAGARYAVTADGFTREGDLPLSSALLLPFGQYQLRITAAPCQAFESSIQVGSSPIERSPMLDCPASER